MHPSKPEVIDGVFYEQQLQKISKNDKIYYVEKILKKRNVKGKKEIYIKWLGYPDRFNEWIPFSNLIGQEQKLTINSNKEEINKQVEETKEEKTQRFEFSV